MALRRTITTLAFTGTLIASPALAAGPMSYGQVPLANGDTPTGYGDTQTGYGDAQTNDNAAVNDADAQMNAPTADETTTCCAGEASPMTSDSVEGKVAAVDHEHGRLVLDTDHGLVSLRTSPEELANVDVGDTVRVSFTDDMR